MIFPQVHLSIEIILIEQDSYEKHLSDDLLDNGYNMSNEKAYLYINNFVTLNFKTRSCLRMMFRRRHVSS
jgi:hypothetical protein